VSESLVVEEEPMLLPRARGPLTGRVVDALRGAGPLPSPLAVPGRSGDLTHDEDVQLALWICYELHYRGFEDVDADWDTHPGLLAFRTGLEQPWLAELRRLARVDVLDPAHVPTALRDLVAADDGPPLAGFLQRSATLAQFREFVAHRSVYHLKEADPHSWALPRLGGRPKAALVEIQADEYGGGRVDRMHAELFGSTMRALGLDDSYGHYVDHVPAVTLAVSNVMSLFGLRRRWVPALLGHLAAFEMTSSLPNRRYGNGLRRLGGDQDATRFYDVHVEADAVHEQIAAHDLCGGYVAEHPDSGADVLFGAACALALDAEFARHLLACWQRGDTSLLRPLADTTRTPTAESA
jgi:hypothetical protein